MLFKLTSPVLRPTVASEVLLLVYVTAPELALVAVTVKISLIFLLVGGFTNARVGAAALETVRVLLVLVALAY